MSMSSFLKKIVKIIFHLSNISIQTVLAIGATIVIAIFSYIILWPYIFSGGPVGSDAYSAFSFVVWFDRYFPNIPFWYPLQGAGVSFVSGYPWLSHYLVVALSRVSQIPLGYAFIILECAAFPISAISTFIYCWFRLDYPKNKITKQAIGLVAALFFLIMPITYIWAFSWGFYAETISYIFVGPALICLDAYIHLSFSRDRTYKKRLALVGAVLFYLLSAATHFGAFVGLTNFTLVMVAGYTIFNIRTLKKDVLKVAFKTLLLLFIPIICIFSVRYMQYKTYMNQVALGGFRGYENANLHIDEQMIPTIKQLFSIEAIGLKDPRHVLNDWAVQQYIWIFAGIGIVIGSIKNRKMLIFAVMLIYGIFCYTNVTVINIIYQRLGQFLGILDPRFVWIPYRFILAITAGYGVFALWEITLLVVDGAISLIKARIVEITWQSILRPIIVISLSLLTLYFTVLSFERNNQTHKLTSIKGFKVGPRIVNETNFLLDPDVADKCVLTNNNNIREIKHSSFCDYKLNPVNQVKDYKEWPIPDFQDKGLVTENERKIISFLKGQEPLTTRYDMSGLNGSHIMQAPIISDVSQTQIYIYQLSLFPALWSYQGSVMYASQPNFQKPGVISELAKWFGYEFIMANPDPNTPTYLYKEDSRWEEQKEGIWHFKEATGLSTWTTKPSLLFIGDTNKYFYDEFFKESNIGILSYDEAIMFNNKEYVDEYSSEELQKYDVLFLNGYKYHDAQKAHDLLDKYVKNGGSLFIDTGWQYTTPDWELKSAPPFMPTNTLEWKNMNEKARLTMDNGKVIGYTNSNESQDIGPLTLLNSSFWGVSTGSSVREGGNVILQSNGNPLLIAREYGKGRVIWSGFNALPHIEGSKNENQKEIEIIHKSISWLLEGKKSPIEEKDMPFRLARSNPDEVTFFLDTTIPAKSILYWRESYYPKWKAFLKHKNSSSQQLVLEKAGPRLMGIHIPSTEKGDIITLKIVKEQSEYIYDALAIFATVMLLFYLINLTRPLEMIVRSGIRKTRGQLKEKNSTFKTHEDPNNAQGENEEY